MIDLHSCTTACNVQCVAIEWLSCPVQVAQEQGYNFDEDDINAMMEVAATVTERASTTNMTFQGFQKLVEHYSTVTST